MGESYEVDRDLHPVSLGDGADVESSGDGTGDRCLLFVIREAFSSVVSAATLRNLKNDRGFDIPGQAQFFS